MEKLTERERTILELVMKGYGNIQISKSIFISTHTVKAHMTAIIRKLNAKNRAHAVYIALKNDLLK